MKAEMAVWQMSASEIAARVRTGALSATDVVTAHLERIEAVNPAVNAVTNVLGEQALCAAAGIDRRRASGEPLGSLAGVPFTVKEDIDVEGSATTFGVPRLRHLVASADAPPVRRLRAADAIPIGRTNLPDLSIGGTHTTSQLYGATKNPWDLRKSPGGSSGGDGVAVATGMAAIGLGNDSGGSIRLPAMFCGVAGLKPSYGRFPADHRIGGSEPTLASQLFPVDGPLARTIADLRATFEVLAGDEPRDPRTVPVALQGPALATPIPVGVVSDPGAAGVHPDVAQAIRRAADCLADVGYAVEEIELPRFADALACYHMLINTEFGLAWHRIRPLLTADSARHLEESMRRQPPGDLATYIAATATRHGIVREWKQLHERFPLVLGPVNTEPAGDPASQPVFKEAIESPLRLCTATSFVGVPAAALPVGLAHDLPVGVQVIGAHHREDLCLAAAAEIEARFGTLTPITP